MGWLCCLGGPAQDPLVDLPSKPVVPVEPELPSKPAPQVAPMSKAKLDIRPHNPLSERLNETSALEPHEEVSELGDHSADFHAPELSQDLASLTSPQIAAESAVLDTVEEPVRPKGRTSNIRKDEDRSVAKAMSHQVTSHGGGEEWRRLKDLPCLKDYSIVKSLGRGAFADVLLGRHRVTEKQHALKVVHLNKPGLKEKHITVLQREGTYLSRLKHRNIVRCSKVYQGTHQWVFVLEYLKGGMLLNDLSKLRHYSEKTAAAVFKQVLLGVAHLHEKNLVHRDIKPENIVFRLAVRNSAAFAKDNMVKIVDFGMILDLTKESNSRGMMGSPGFVAPEVILGQQHTTQMDNYSLGVLLFVMLVGAKPMTQEQARSLQYALMTPENLRGMQDPRWRVLTDSAKHLVLKLLQPDPKHRYTAKQALNHHWISGARDESILDGSVMEGWTEHAQMMPAAFMGNTSPFGNFAPSFGNLLPSGARSPYANYHSPMAAASSSRVTAASTMRSGRAQASNTAVSPGPTASGASRTLPWPAPGEGHSQPLAWTCPAEVHGHSTPLSAAGGGASHPMGDPLASGHTHEEAMMQAHANLMQAQQLYAMVHKQAALSGRLPPTTPTGGTVPPSPSFSVHAHTSPSPTGFSGGLPTAPPSPVRQRTTSPGGLSGGLATDNSEVTPWASRHDTSLSAVGQSFMSSPTSTMLTQGTTGVSGPLLTSWHRSLPSKEQDLDAIEKVARDLVAEINKAPSLSRHSLPPASTSNSTEHLNHPDQQQYSKAMDVALGMITACQKAADAGSSKRTTPRGRPSQPGVAATSLLPGSSSNTMRSHPVRVSNGSGHATHNCSGTSSHGVGAAAAGNSRSRNVFDPRAAGKTAHLGGDRSSSDGHRDKRRGGASAPFGDHHHHHALGAVDSSSAHGHNGASAALDTNAASLAMMQRRSSHSWGAAMQSSRGGAPSGPGKTPGGRTTHMKAPGHGSRSSCLDVQAPLQVQKVLQMQKALEAQKEVAAQKVLRMKKELANVTKGS